MTVRFVAPFSAGLSETGFWAGLTAGRVVLGFITGRIGEKLAILASPPSPRSSRPYSSCVSYGLTSCILDLPGTYNRYTLNILPCA